MTNWLKWTLGGLIATALSGCADTEKLQYVINETDDVNYYVDAASQIDYAHVEHERDRASFARPPRTIDDLTRDEVRDFSLAECMALALQNARIIRTGSSFLSGGNPILSNPNNAPSVYDPAIQETGVLFQGRGVEAALSAFDAQFSTQATWGRSELVRNAGFITGGFNETVGNSTGVVSQLSKTFGYGAQFQVGQEINYSKNNTPGLFGSSYSGNVSASYRHPLLAGAGTEYTQIAGPISTQFGGLSGVNQGVVIARINHDITLADFEQNMVNLLKDVEDAYWNLYLQYRVYDTQVKARQSARKSWSDAKAKLDQGGAPGFRVEDEPIARDAYFQTKVLTEETLSQLYKSEISLRRLIGLPVNDGEILRPSDEPMTAAFKPDWAVSIAEGLTHRVEIRRHKWNIKSLELQLLAAEGLVKPRLDLIASYQVNGFGDHLIKDDRNSFSSFSGTITDNNHTGWTAGAIFEMPLGLRSARAQVQNLELRLRKAREILGAQEHDVSHELAIAYQELAEKYRTARSNYNRRAAAAERKRILFLKVQRGTETIEEYLRSVASYADAEIAYYRSLVAYSQAVTNLQFRQGTLLQHNSITLAEGDWEPEAYVDALRKARARSNAFDADSMLQTEPMEFVETDPHWNDGGSHEVVLTVEPLPAFNEDPAGEPTDEAASPVEAKRTLPVLIPPPSPETETPPPQEKPAPLKPGTASRRPAIPQSPPPSFLAVPSPILREALRESGSRHLKPRRTTTKLPADNGAFLPPVRASSTRVQTR
jgi:outer membrane protein TolC